MAHSNNKQTSTSNGVPPGALQSRNGKAYSAGNDEGETHDKKAHRFFSSKKFAILFVVACIFLTHQDDFETQEQHVAKVRVRNRVARSLAKVKATPSDDELELDPMAFEHYDDAPPTYEQTYEGAYDDVDEPYEQAYESPPKRVYSRNQWSTPKKRCYRDGAGAILKERKVVEYEIPQQVHYEKKWKIEHDEREEEVHNGDKLSADVAVAEAVATSSTSLSKVGEDGSLPPSPQNNVQNKGQSAKTEQESKGPSGTGTTRSTASTRSIGSTMHGKQVEAVNINTGRDFSRRKLAKYIVYSCNGYRQYVLTWDIPELLPKAKAKAPKKNILTDQNCIKTRSQTRGTPDKSRDTPRNRKQLTKHNFLYCTSG
ncbi:hypothetical protein AK88_05510 [Plasmodium fragile]|uniref:Uncharacterized protein n=1 Tax=Plasmodium fragile TaxID=5857 RepID=A0A0D9QCS4_PLAFR|nr:uncharacterized protein AK88_05510 [Plasmodium fragile]KJP84855.1 hypothetical protein AK88_05510 [Plasmodium fragile]